MKLHSSSETGTCSFMPNLSGHLFVHSVYFCQMGGQTVTADRGGPASDSDQQPVGY